MKKSSSGITIAEVVVAMLIFSVTMVSVINLQGSLLESSVKVEKKLKLERFSDYIDSLVNNLSVPAYADWTDFFIEQTWNNTFSFWSWDDIMYEMPIWFFRLEERFPYYHKITKVSNSNVWWVNFATYRIEVWYSDSKKTYYIIK